jgi:hypothetical protein
MGFWSTFFSTFFAFLFAILIFFLSRFVIKYFERKRLQKNLINEFELNELFLHNLLRELEHLEYLSFRNIARNEKKVSAPVYTNYRRFFTEAYFKDGVLYEKLRPVDIRKLDKILTVMSVDHHNYVTEKFNEWQACNGDVNGDMSFRNVLENEIAQISQFVKDVREIREKIEKKSKRFPWIF